MSDFYTIDTLLTFGGAVAAIWLVPNVLIFVTEGKAQPYAKWIGLAVALGLSMLGAATASGDWTRFVVAFFNGLILFAAAFGINESAAEVTARRVKTRGLVGGARFMWPTWF